MTTLTITYSLIDKVRRTEYVNAAEARRALLHFAETHVYDRDGSGEQGTLFAGRNPRDREVVATYVIK